MSGGWRDKVRNSRGSRHEPAAVFAEDNDKSWILSTHIDSEQTLNSISLFYIWGENVSENCPFCGAPLNPSELSEHVKRCPGLKAKRQIAVAPGGISYEEGELPPHLKEILRGKGSFLTDEVVFVG